MSIQIVPSRKHNFYFHVTYISASSALLVPSSSAVQEDNTLLGLFHHEDEGSMILRNVTGPNTVATPSDNFRSFIAHLPLSLLKHS